MWKNVVFSALFFLLFQISYAQHQEPCASHLYLQQLDETYPGFRAATQVPFSRVRTEGQARDLTLLTVPVVVHIVYQNEEQNISDEAIQDVMDVLNEDYRRLNEDADQIREEFEEIVADPFIQFELMGVERVPTTSTFQLQILGGGLPDNVKQTANGGSDAWDTEHYLNIWVCHIEGGGLLGHAYPPANLVNWPAGANAPSPELDGVVIHQEIFRRSGDYTTMGLLGGQSITIPVRGRTITHEVGHYLGLRHIWGDGTFAILGIPDCNADDGVEDTPNQGLSSQFVCDPDNNGCNEGPNDLPDMWENYMDYSKEDCQNSFTTGQVELMRSVLENERAGLLEGAVSTHNLAEVSSLKVYPNPNQGWLVIEQANEHAISRTRLLNPQGQLLQTWPTWTGIRQQLQLAEVPAGLYYLQLTTENGTITKAIVVE